MEIKQIGYVIINVGHPVTGDKYVVNNSFRIDKKQAISDFIDGTGGDWGYWRDRYNFRCVKATQTINTITDE